MEIEFEFNINTKYSYMHLHVNIHIMYIRVVQTCGSGTKFGSLGQNFCIHFVLSYF